MTVRGRLSLGLALLVCAACASADDRDACEQTSASAAEPTCAPVSPERTERPARVTLDSLLEELWDLDLLTYDDTAPFFSRLASSYDRAAQSSTEPSWFANDDRGQYLAKHGEENVLMDASGPGVITRIWSANPSGELRIYIDDLTTPALQVDMEQLLSGAVEPFASPFAFRVAGGYNFYFPLAFQTAARVTVVTSASDLYYHVNWRSYGADAEVESFDLDRVSQLRRKRAAAAEQLRGKSAEPGATTELVFATDQTEWQQLDVSGPGALTWIELRPERSDPASLRGTALELRFDGKQTVSVPLGDFFGSGPGLAASASIATRMERSGRLTSRFVMPFHERAEMRLRRTTAAAMKVRTRYRTERRAHGAAQLYFYAGWTGLRSLDVQSPSDLHLIALKGRGHYVGMVLNVANPDPQWWGEGDEKIYLDDEPFPSHFGTGTEDYFGYAWCSTEHFSTAFVGQTRANPSNNAGHVSLYRLHLLDRIRFDRSFVFDLEALHWGTTHRSIAMTFDAVYFWYGDPDALDLADPPPAERWLIPELPAGTIEPQSRDGTSCG